RGRAAGDRVPLALSRTRPAERPVGIPRGSSPDETPVADCHDSITAVPWLGSGRPSVPIRGDRPDAAESPSPRGGRAGDPPQYWGEHRSRAWSPAGEGCFLPQPV